MRQVLRLMHRSLRTEQAYIGWVRRFYDFVQGQSPFGLDSTGVKNFMTHLAVERKVSASTQNQAFNAILFFFRHILDKNIDLEREAVTVRSGKDDKDRKTVLPVSLKDDVTAQIERPRTFYEQDRNRNAAGLMSRAPWKGNARMPI